MQNNEIELAVHDFPEDGETLVRLLPLMGDDYLDRLVYDLHCCLVSEYPDARLVAVKCEVKPDVIVEKDSQGTVTSGSVGFGLQVLLKDRTSAYWRLYLVATYEGQQLDNPETRQIQFSMEVDRRELATE